MFALVGLGNPGSKYQFTRHNVGFDVVEKLVAGVLPGGGGSRWNKRDEVLLQAIEIAGETGLALLPQSFMNNSGQAASPIIRFYKIPLEKVIVVHDELDLKVGSLRVKQGGSAGGHRGVEDLERALGSANFIRVRVGIGRPDREQRNQDIVSWVLSPPFREEEEQLVAAKNLALEAIKEIICRGLESAQQRFNRTKS